MKRKLLKSFILSLSLLSAGSGLSLGQSDPCAVEIGSHTAVTPVGRPDVSWWMPRHEAVLERVAEGDVDLIMIGDSITHGWEKSGKATWDEYYAPRNAVNMGFSGDRTEHVLWRLQNGEIDNIDPKLAVLMIGTNNSGGNQYSAEQIADGIKAIVCTLRTELPDTKVLILAIFPRGDAAQRKDETKGASYNEMWAKNAKASELVSQLADDKMIFFLDINDAFLDENGVLPREVMPDLLHPREKGYQIWAEAMEPSISALMLENQ
ncbi:GDSL family lipase [Ruficoccus amylovorans]|uniref:GDSL family lipase n=1 Tax=Ruficoccus amylovorans TaxID=1804625 RepID=A0A842H9V8_9BACT|nr:platelet-activating factor acetylhydrolase IB subunit [Ruficoccus amylovorans]MBC2592888.1 GDSL family lipase [Ruficoccus amylovorans]